MARVLVLGGGFGGVAAATELRSVLPEADEIVLIAASDRFFMGFAKLWELAGVRPVEEGSRALETLGDRGIRFVHGEITAIDPVNRVVSTTAGDLTGDALLVALGTVPAPHHRVLLREADGHDLYDAREIAAMRAAIDGVSAGRIVVAILGGPFKCPPAPYEAVLIVDELLRERRARGDIEVAIVTPQPMTLPAAGPDASRFVAERLAERGVELFDRRVVSEAGGGLVRFEDGDDLDCSLLLGVPAEMAPGVIIESGLAGVSGFVEPDRATLRTEHDRVYAVGDCTMIPTATAQLPKAGVFAAAEGWVAARNIASDLHGTDGAAFDGHGLCFLEFPDRKVAVVEGNFFAEPKPDVELSEATDANFERKQRYEAERLAEWFGE